MRRVPGWSNRTAGRRALPSLAAAVLALALAGGAGPGAAQALADASPPDSVYEQGPRSRDGIGKFYYGREISQVMASNLPASLRRRL